MGRKGEKILTLVVFLVEVVVSLTTNYLSVSWRSECRVDGIRSSNPKSKAMISKALHCPTLLLQMKEFK